MEGMSGADPTDVTEKKRLQNRMAQQKYRQRLKDRIREFEELKKHLGDLPEMKDYVETGYSPPSTNIQNGGYDTKSTNFCLLQGQEVGPPESDPYPWAVNCPPISPAQSNTYPKIEPRSALDLLSPTVESLDYSSFSLSNESQKHVGSCARLAHQWSWALSASSPRVSNSLDPHQATQDNQLAVSPDDQLFRGASCEERFIDILNSIHQAGFESIEKMIVEYYTTRFKSDSIAHWSQKSSRRYRLRGMLQDVYHDSQSWPVDERMVFHDALAYIAAHEQTAKTQYTHMLGTTF